MKVIQGGVCAASGFTAGAVHSGIRKARDRDDLALIVSSSPCQAAAVYTRNQVKADPLQVTRDHLSDHTARAVIVNSGNANACAMNGHANAVRQCEAAARYLGVDVDDVLVASTGVIGMQLPMDRIAAGVEKLAAAKDGSEKEGLEAAKAIMTTDTKPKYVGAQIEIGGKTVTIGGMCKGSGMIHPNMCTMLGFITTDAAITKELLQKALSDDIKDTFNMISVDGDTSTNDTVLLLANGMAENPVIDDENSPEYAEFKKALNYVNTELSKKIAGDGEGATCLFEVKVVGAESKEQAVTLSKSVVMSTLTKAAIYGHDANWGRILCAMGYSGAQFDPEKVDLYFESKAGKLKIIENGVSTGYSEEVATKILSEDHVTAIADVKMGDCTATAWGCDLTHEYVNINADYRS